MASEVLNHTQVNESHKGMPIFGWVGQNYRFPSVSDSSFGIQLGAEHHTHLCCMVQARLAFPIHNVWISLSKVSAWHQL